MQQKNNSNIFIEVERWSAWNEPRIELPEGPFVHGCQVSKKGMGICFTSVFRWFKFTLKPPYSITCGKLQLAIWDTFFLDFLAQIWTQGTLRHILGPILIIFEICQFLMIPGPFEYFSENGWS